MSTSAETHLRFVFDIVDGVKILWQTYTSEEFIRKCAEFLVDKPKHDVWQLKILRAMREVLSEARNRTGLEARLNDMIRFASTHPDRDALVTDLGRRALLGELRFVAGDTADAYPNFAAQLGRLYEGSLTHDDLWRQAWQRAASALNIDISEAP